MTLLIPWKRTSSFQNYETINFCCLTHPVCGTRAAALGNQYNGFPGLRFWNNGVGVGMVLCPCWGLPHHDPRWLMGTDSLEGWARASATMLPSAQCYPGVRKRRSHPSRSTEPAENLQKASEGWAVFPLYSHTMIKGLYQEWHIIAQWSGCRWQWKGFLGNFPCLSGVWSTLVWGREASDPPVIFASP